MAGRNPGVEATLQGPHARITAFQQQPGGLSGPRFIGTGAKDDDVLPRRGRSPEIQGNRPQFHGHRSRDGPGIERAGQWRTNVDDRWVGSGTHKRVQLVDVDARTSKQGILAPALPPLRRSVAGHYPRDENQGSNAHALSLCEQYRDLRVHQVARAQAGSRPEHGADTVEKQKG